MYGENDGSRGMVDDGIEGNGDNDGGKGNEVGEEWNGEVCAVGCDARK